MINNVFHTALRQVCSMQREQYLSSNHLFFLSFSYVSLGCLLGVILAPDFGEVRVGEIGRKELQGKSQLQFFVILLKQEVPRQL